jgi:asparagine synthase (glutamine-hydrolysing)
MCGIFGARLTTGTIAPELVRAATDRLAHRGPDEAGTWVSKDQRAALGHRRLSIVGLDNGAQPITNEDATIHIAVNGEFYDFPPIRRELEARGHRFRTRSDSEIALHLYEEHGAGCLCRLRGEFAFVLWDETRRRLFAARDRFGIKPLYYLHQSSRLLLASEVKSLIGAGYCPAWDCESFFLVSALQYLLPDRSLFQGVQQLAPGHYLVFEDGKLTVHRYWDIEHPPESQVSASGGPFPAEMVERCRELVVDAVEVRLAAEVPICCHLSGGLDSSTILGVATRFQPGLLDAFTLCFDEQEYDESVFAAQTAEHFGARLHRVLVSQDDLLGCLDEAVRGSEGLAINGHLPAKHLLHRAIRDAGFKVVLSGEGADEAFGGYAHLRIEFLKRAGDEAVQRQLVASNQTSVGMMLPYGPALDLDSVQKRLGFTPAYLQAKAGLGWRVQSLMHPEFLRTFRGRDAFGELLDATDAATRCTGRHPVDQATWLWSKTALAGYILRTLGDGTEMPASVEGRVPFLDHRLFEFLAAIPAERRMRGPIDKFLLRAAARPFIPPVVYRRPKHPLDAPPLCLFASSGGLAAMGERLRRPSFQRQPFFCTKRCEALLDQIPRLDVAERRAWDPALMVVLTTDAMQKWMDEETPGVTA